MSVTSKRNFGYRKASHDVQTMNITHDKGFKARGNIKPLSMLERTARRYYSRNRSPKNSKSFTAKNNNKSLNLKWS